MSSFQRIHEIYFSINIFYSVFILYKNYCSDIAFCLCSSCFVTDVDSDGGNKSPDVRLFAQYSPLTQQNFISKSIEPIKTSSARLSPKVTRAYTPAPTKENCPSLVSLSNSGSKSYDRAQQQYCACRRGWPQLYTPLFLCCFFAPARASHWKKTHASQFLSADFINYSWLFASRVLFV